MKNDYNKYYPVAEAIYSKLYGVPKSHHEWANAFNIRGDIVRILIKMIKD